MNNVVSILQSVGCRTSAYNKWLFSIAPTSVANVTQGRGLKWVYPQYRGKIAEAFSAHLLLVTPQLPGNEPSPIHKEKYSLELLISLL